MTNWHVGQTVFVEYTYSHSNKKRDLRERMHLEHERFDLESGALDGGNHISPGNVYRSQAEYDECQRQLARRAHLKKAFLYFPTLTDEQVTAIGNVICGEGWEAE